MSDASLARQGAEVFIAEIDPDRCASFTAGTAIECDVTDRQAVAALADTLAQATGGKLDVLKNGPFLAKWRAACSCWKNIKHPFGIWMASIA